MPKVKMAASDTKATNSVCSKKEFWEILGRGDKAFENPDFYYAESYLEEPNEGSDNEEKVTPLLYAIYAEDIDLVRTLLAEGANPTTTFADHLTPLMIATELGFVSIVQLLLSTKNPDLDPLDILVLVAAKNGHAELVRMMLDEGAYIAIPDELLFFAAKEGYTQVAQILLDRAHASVEAKGNEDSTALMIAIANQHTDIVEMLLLKGADTRVKNRNNLSVIDIARSIGNLNLVRRLIYLNQGQSTETMAPSLALFPPTPSSTSLESANKKDDKTSSMTADSENSPSSPRLG